MTRRLLLTLALAGAAAAAGTATAAAQHDVAQTKHVCVVTSSQPSGNGYDGYCVSVWVPLSGT